MSVESADFVIAIKVDVDAMDVIDALDVHTRVMRLLNALMRNTVATVKSLATLQAH